MRSSKILLLALVLSLFGCGNVELQPAQKESPSVNEIIPPTDIAPEEVVDLFPELPAIDLVLVGPSSGIRTREGLIEILSYQNIELTADQRNEILNAVEPDINAKLKFKVQTTAPFALSHGEFYYQQLQEIPYQLIVRIKNDRFSISHLNSPLNNQLLDSPDHNNMPLNRIHAYRLNATPETVEIAYAYVSGLSQPNNGRSLNIIIRTEFSNRVSTGVAAIISIYPINSHQPGSIPLATSTSGFMPTAGPSICSYVASTIPLLCPGR